MVSFNEGDWMIYDANVTLVDGTVTSAYYMPLAAGNYEFMAVYHGDSNYRCSMSGEDDEPLAVLPGLGAGEPVTDLGTSAIVLGQSVTDNATKTGFGAPFPVPTGDMTFQVSVNGGEWATYSVNAMVNGAATSAFYMPKVAGDYNFRAIYSGDSNYVGGTSADDAEPLLVNPAATHTTTCLSHESIVLGNSVFDKAFVSGLGCGFPVPTGFVDFQVSNDNGCSWMTYDSCEPLSNGVAVSTSYTPMAAGTYWFQAVYSSDSNYLGSQSCSFSEKLCVERAPSYTYTCLGTDTIVLGQSVKDNVTVVGLGCGFPVPTGPVEFQVSLNNGSWTTYYNGALDCHGQATSCWYTPMCAGHYEFRVIYSCDSNYLESTSCPHSEQLCVEKAPSQTTTDLGI
jgi:hypothetical protein